MATAKSMYPKPVKRPWPPPAIEVPAVMTPACDRAVVFEQHLNHSKIGVPVPRLAMLDARMRRGEPHGRGRRVGRTAEDRFDVPLGHAGTNFQIESSVDSLRRQAEKKPCRHRGDSQNRNGYAK